MTKYTADVQSGDLFGVTVSDGIYLMDDDKMYTDDDFSDAEGVTPVENGPEIELSGNAVALAADYANTRSRAQTSVEGMEEGTD